MNAATLSEKVGGCGLQNRQTMRIIHVKAGSAMCGKRDMVLKLTIDLPIDALQRFGRRPRACGIDWGNSQRSQFDFGWAQEKSRVKFFTDNGLVIPRHALECIAIRSMLSVHKIRA